jgi:hypothetical protein
MKKPLLKFQKKYPSIYGGWGSGRYWKNDRSVLKVAPFMAPAQTVAPPTGLSCPSSDPVLVLAPAKVKIEQD